MTPAGLFFASGDSLYAGAALLLLVMAPWPYLRHIVAWVALAMIVMACPPFSWFVDAIFLTVFLLWLLAASWPVVLQQLTGVPDFGQGLDVLLSKLAVPGRTLVMFELPLLPHKIAFGQIQRRLAATYGVSLIPKRFFIDVIGGANATSAGLHLSNAGARRMAVLVSTVLSPVLKLPATGRLDRPGF